MRLSWPSGANDPDSHRHLIIRGAWITVVVIIAMVALAAMTTWMTSIPGLCGSCHEMSPAVDAWKTSVHAQVGCADCHEPPRPWYRFPETMVFRGVMLRRDLVAHLTRATEDTASITAVTIPDSRCLRCHDPGREVTVRYATGINHTEHAERLGSCTSCHRWTAHPDPSAEAPLLFMAQCFGCHGLSSAAEAPGACDVCHPPSFELRPPSHAPSDWQARHGETAKPDRQQCLMCHEGSFCRDCHGVEMPHPSGWDDGASGHGPIAAESRRVCTNCHPGEPDFCSMCHHEGFQPKEGPWTDQHPELVADRGASFCLECHDPLYCYDCHTIGRVEAGADADGMGSQR